MDEDRGVRAEAERERRDGRKRKARRRAEAPQRVPDFGDGIDH